MRFRAVLLLPLDQQGDLGDYRIDPAGVRFAPDHEYVIHREFDYAQPPVGTGKIVSDDDGSLVVEGVLEDDSLNYLAVGVVADDYARARTGPAVVQVSRVMDISTTRQHKDKNQPPIEFLED
jgi:hypothetical protein